MKLHLMKYRTIWLSIAVLFTALSIACLATKGFNLGIDFTGGSLIDVRFEKSVSIGEVRDIMDKQDLGNSSMIQVAGQSGKDAQAGNNIFIRTRDLSDEERVTLMKNLGDKFGQFNVLRIEKVGATVGSELAKNALIACGISLLLILIYISARFEYRFAVAGIISLIYNVLVTMGIYSFLGGTVDSNFIAAILTILGFSINDTIVIYDRIRENLKSRKPGESLMELVDFSINQYLKRSIFTVAIVLFTTVALYLFGGDTTKDLALVMTIGFTFGCVTSVFIAPAIWLMFKNEKPATTNQG